MKNRSRVVVVTGAMGGIGLEICKTLGSKGFIVIGIYNNQYKEAEWINHSNLDELIQCDINDTSVCNDTVTQIINKYGRIDALVNVAGITLDTTFKNMSFSDWNQVLQTNLVALYNITHPIFINMLSNKFGRIVNISSVNGHKGQFGQVNYAAAKAGIYGFTKSLALEGAAKGITVNSISPGYIETSMTAVIPEVVLTKIKSQIPLGELGKPSDVSRTVAFLVDDDASYITGEDINVNGGLVMV
ncbi:3-oxoacyl-ACP reductase [Pseudoalteromonas sp. S3173]|uniref:3-oxoacyl-ACP reductase n=1 Tax=Pseudoalteromonas sp. S3173 TaxID=579531 RepID=UPI00110CEF82|nr:3-oxoacyl-ACP reductase [Pseudoalteromonas sp. S3173]TMS60474.1 beta-ketoacyl-ACP reductase [Pseudoalteromonas sp. S3173]